MEIEYHCTVCLYGPMSETQQILHTFSKLFTHLKALSVVPFSCPAFLLLRIPKHEVARVEKKNREQWDAVGLEHSRGKQFCRVEMRDQMTKEA